MTIRRFVSRRGHLITLYVMRHQFASVNNQETKNADSSYSEEPDNSQSVLSFEERGRNREFLTGALRTD